MRTGSGSTLRTPRTPRARSGSSVLLQVVVLVRVNELQVLAAVEHDRVVLAVRLVIAKSRVAGQLDAELGTPAARPRDEPGVVVDKRGEQTRVDALLVWGLLLQVHDLQVGMHAARTWRSPLCG